MALTILGLLIPIVGLLALRPQLEVSPIEAVERDKPLSVPFAVKNVGLTSLTKVRAYFYIHHMELAGMTFDQSLMGDIKVNELDRGEPKTIMFKWNLPTGMRPSKADIAVIVEYHAPWIPFKNFHRIFRFIGVYGDKWEWQAQPSDEIKKDAEAQIEKLQETLPN